MRRPRFRFQVTSIGGALSVSGGRESSNGFMLNGANVEEGVNNGAAIIPNLDSIAEFRIITNNFDAEYGNYSGGQINAVTKSGTNQIHGDVFEFLRNSDLDARNYYSPTGAPFNKINLEALWAAQSGAIRCFTLSIIRAAAKSWEWTVA